MGLQLLLENGNVFSGLRSCRLAVWAGGQYILVKLLAEVLKLFALHHGEVLASNYLRWQFQVLGAGVHLDLHIILE